MPEQYWIGGFFIDLSRNQITQNRQSQTLAPKALAVLTCLAENQGKVVSHDVLLDKVWQNSVVLPNTLQRSIAQLRKALGDDGKGQIFIKTHAKQGYSLECDVRWDPHGTTDCGKAQEGTDSVSDAQRVIKKFPKSLRPGLKIAAIASSLFVMGFIGFHNINFQQATKLTFDSMELLTATDDKEFDATYTPDGQYIVFHRYLDKTCVNKLWAKNIHTKRETLLTKDWGAYGSHSFSKDGRTLAFLATEACTEPVAQKNCYDLVSVDFAKALQSPQQPNVILQCKNSVVKNPEWLSNDNIALLQSTSNRWKLINYSLSENKSTDLYNIKNGNLIDFTVSAADDLIAVISVHSNGEHHIDMLKPNGHIVSSHPIERSHDLPEFRRIYPSFDPLNKQLIFSTGRQLFTLSYEGKVTKISMPSADRMMQPVFHPDGKRVLMIKGPYDSDIAKLSLADFNSVDPNTVHSYTIFERSNLGENHGIFQPGGELIAFWSERSGEEQLWISDSTGSKQLTHFPVDTSIAGIDWAADGKSLLVNANNNLTQVFLDSSKESFPLAYPVARLYQWDSVNNTALLAVRIKGQLKFVEYDLNRSEIREAIEDNILWAQKSEDGQLIYKDNMDKFWRSGPVEPQHIAALDGQGGRAKSFVLKGNTIYAINTKDQLWSYDLDENLFKILGKVNRDVNYLTDNNKHQFLMTVKVSAKKEIVELFKNE